MSIRKASVRLAKGSRDILIQGYYDQNRDIFMGLTDKDGLVVITPTINGTVRLGGEIADELNQAQSKRLEDSLIATEADLIVTTRWLEEDRVFTAISRRSGTPRDFVEDAPPSISSPERRSESR